MKNKYFLSVLLLSTLFGNAQETEPKIDSLKEIVVTSSRIDLPFKENSRTIQIVTAEDIKKLGVTNVADALQQVAGIDVRRQGVNGMQADLYIRGGSFDQTLLLIDGIKVDDPQTGHHTLNLALPIEVIERIEVIKGPAARVFGQNAFTGAVNIITKNNPTTGLSLKIQTGSFHQFNTEISGGINMENSNHIVHFSKNSSEGYRFNSDFENTNYVLKSQFNKDKFPIHLIAALSERKFGAQNFYGVTGATAVPYEETQASLVGFSTTIKNGNFTWKPRIYWRRNQDEYIFIRTNPSFYRNLHITNKIAAELNGSYYSNIGITGFGFETSKVYISSNNLGGNHRFISTLFLEHRFNFIDKKFDFTPGVSVSYYSDFKFQAFPGVDLGYQLNENTRIYGNIGYTYRIPSYTDLNYFSPENVGNPNLEPEKALSEEIGLKWQSKTVNFYAAGFYRNALKFIDYVRLTDVSPWQPQVIEDVITKGIEAQFDYKFKVFNFNQKMQLGYTFIDNKIKNDGVQFSQYGLNSMKHQVVTTLNLQFFKNFTNSVLYRYVERTSGNSYSVVDLSAAYKMQNFEFTIFVNNLFNKQYFENTFVPMPKGNVLFGMKYLFK
jgi:iron complex outermembrane receptor protein